ncbi:MAG TPA: LacI family DNA-binding transcriptional regulator [Microlunatus sp.]|nr:LacI family DNA-binding transcriptional regulator [Microlunatus sp.]
MSRPRLVDVAARAGVSRTTASAALSGGGRIGEETRRHVLAVAAEMGYEANRLAQNLRIRRAGAIGVYVPPDATGYEYYLAFAFGVVDEAMRRETPVVLIPNGTTEVSLARDQVDGYIVIDAADEDRQLRRILATGKPVVSAEPLPDDLPPPAGTVSFDHEKAATALLDHLAAQGAHRPAMISPPLDTSWARQINTAYARWCARAGCTPRVVTAPFLADADSIRHPVEQLFSGGDEPDAVVVAQDGIAPAVSAAVNARGKVVGDDVLLAACVDGLSVRSSVPPITAIDLIPREHGTACADLLLSVLSGDGGPSRSITLEPVLHLRASTGA